MMFWISGSKLLPALHDGVAVGLTSVHVGQVHLGRLINRMACMSKLISALLCFVQGQQKTAIQHLERVLEISQIMGEHVGDADDYGTIADIYTDMGQFEKAAKYYDRYIGTMSSDSPV